MDRNTVGLTDLFSYGGTGLVNGACQACLPGQAQDYDQWTVPCHTCLSELSYLTNKSSMQKKKT